MPIHRRIQQSGFALIDPMHRIEPANALLEPLSHQSHDVDAKRRWSVPHRVFLGVVAIAQVSRQAIAAAFEQVLANDHDRHSGRTRILLRTSVHNPVLGNI